MPASPETTLYLDGRVTTGRDEPDREAIAIAGDRVLAVGATAELRDAFPRAAEVDLRGRRVIPGLIDGHSHIVRGGLGWLRELDWTGARTRESALGMLAALVATLSPGDWVSVTSGWHESQFADGWRPSRADLDTVAPANPVYSQCLYEHGVLNSAALAAVDLDGLPEGSVQRGPDGAPTGRVEGMPAFTRVLGAMGAPSLDEQLRGTRLMLSTLAARGVTGVNDPGGFTMGPEQYDAVYELWRRGELDVRLRLYLSALDTGHEVEQVTEWLRHAQPGFGDDWLRIAGTGEVVHFGCHDFEGLTDFHIGEDALAQFEQISRLAAARRWQMQVHAVAEESVDRILSVWERVDADSPIRDLRFFLAHGDRASRADVARMAALGVGVVVDDRQVFRSAASRAAWGDDAMPDVPPIGDFVAAGVPLGAGTDGTRASSYDPWVSIWWLVAGRSLDGGSRRAERHLLDRRAALRAYSAANAWFTREEGVRGVLAPGALADLAVLSEDALEVEEDALPGIRSELTVAGGRVTHSTGELAELAVSRR